MRSPGYLLLAIACWTLAGCDESDSRQLAVGQLASERIELVSEVSEPIVGIDVSEGAAVRRGDVLVRFDTARATARLDEANAALDQAQARLAELTRGPRSEQISAARANVAGATKELEFRRADYTRIEELHARNLASADALDRARAARDAASAAFDLRRAELSELLAGTTVEELAQAEAAVKLAAARVRQADIDLERHTIRAPADGLFDSRLFELGERPQAGQVVAVMLDGAKPHARVFVPEEIRVHVGPGDAARVFVDGIAEPLPGRVRWVASDAAYTPYFALTERDRGRLSYAAKIDIDYDGPRLPDGVPVNVEILSASTAE